MHGTTDPLLRPENLAPPTDLALASVSGQPIASGKFYVCIRNWIFALVMEMRKLQLDLFFTGSLVPLLPSISCHPLHSTTFHYLPLLPTFEFHKFFLRVYVYVVVRRKRFWQLSENCLNFLHSFWVFGPYFSLLLSSIGFWFYAFALWAFVVHEPMAEQTLKMTAMERGRRRRRREPENRIILWPNAY